MHEQPKLSHHPTRRARNANNAMTPREKKKKVAHRLRPLFALSHPPACTPQQNTCCASTAILRRVHMKRLSRSGAVLDDHGSARHGISNTEPQPMAVTHLRLTQPRNAKTRGDDCGWLERNVLAQGAGKTGPRFAHPHHFITPRCSNKNPFTLYPPTDRRGQWAPGSSGTSRRGGRDVA